MLLKVPPFVNVPYITLQEPANLRIIVAGAVVVKPCFVIEPSAGIFE